MTIDNPQRIAIRARVIRHRLLARNGSPTFRDILAGMSDAELIAREDRHHQDTVRWLKETREENSQNAQA